MWSNLKVCLDIPQQNWNDTDHPYQNRHPTSLKCIVNSFNSWTTYLIYSKYPHKPHGYLQNAIMMSPVFYKHTQLWTIGKIAHFKAMLPLNRYVTFTKGFLKVTMQFDFCPTCKTSTLTESLFYYTCIIKIWEHPFKIHDTRAR